MSPETIGGWATAIGVMVAIYFGIRGDNRAKAAAERAEEAARVANGYTDRVVDALERMASRDPAGTITPPLRVRWSLVLQSGDRYILANDGNATARKVEISAHKFMNLMDVPPAEDVEPGSVLSFIASPSFGIPDLTITVTWTDDQDKRLVWKYPLPLPLRG